MAYKDGLEHATHRVYLGRCVETEPDGFAAHYTLGGLPEQPKVVP